MSVNVLCKRKKNVQAIHEAKPKEEVPLERVEPADKLQVLIVFTYINIQTILSLLKDRETVAAAIKRLKKDKPAFDRIVSASDALMSIGFSEVFTQPREALLTSFRRTTGTLLYWQYKWPTDEAVYGPYTNEDMAKWQEQACDRPFNFNLGILHSHTPAMQASRQHWQAII